MPMRLPLLLVLVVAAGGAVLLATRCDLGWADASTLTKTPEVFVEVPLVALAAEPAAEASAPSLQGRCIERPAVPATTGVDVQVVARAGQPVPERQVIARWTVPDTDTEREARGRTDDEGRAVLLEVPQDGSARVSVWGLGDAPPMADDDPRVTGSDLVIRIEALIEATLLCVDAETGLEVDRAGALWFDGVTYGDLAHAPAGTTCTCVALVAPPSGYVDWDEAAWTLGIGQWTRGITAVYPLRREVDVNVTVFDHEGYAEPAADIAHFTVAGRASAEQFAASTGPGTFRLHGVPFLRGEPLMVEATAPYLREPITQTLALSSHPRDRTEMVIVLPAPGTQPELGPQSGSFGGRGPCSRFLRCGSHTRGAFELRVLRYDGTPASHAVVHVGPSKLITDADGVARDTSFPTGTYRVRTATIGLLPITGQLKVVNGETARLELRESRGGAIDVRVTDADGDPLPFATISLKLPSTRTAGGWVDEQGGVQRVDPFTDHLGHRRLARVECGEVEVHARWGSRLVTTEVLVREGQVVPVTLVLR